MKLHLISITLFNRNNENIILTETGYFGLLDKHPVIAQIEFNFSKYLSYLKLLVTSSNQVCFVENKT
jgi:hypothetical protein